MVLRSKPAQAAVITEQTTLNTQVNMWQRQGGRQNVQNAKRVARWFMDQTLMLQDRMLLGTGCQGIKMQIDLSTFNPPQREAILHDKGPMLVLAGAGSGKTRVITYRIAYLVAERGVHPSSILAVTFTNKAAKEMKERLAHLMGKCDILPHVSTFHSFCARVLRSEIEVLGYRSTYSILDTDDCKKVLIDSANACSLDSKKYKPQVVGGLIDQWKNEGMLPQNVPLTDDHFKMNCLRIYKEYQKRLKLMNGLDFGDLLIYVLKIFRDHPDILAKYHRKYKYCLVDEMQDTNTVQFSLIKKLAGSLKNIFLVGDDDQSVYSFRGANLDNILGLRRTFPDINIVKMEQNYRCTKTILEAANSVIANNEDRMGKTLFTENRQGDPIYVAEVETEKHESLYIAQEIMRNKSIHNRPYSDHAVLYRVNALSRSIEESMLRYGIPYEIVGGLRFFDRMEIKDAMAYLRLIANPDDDMALRRIINTPARGIGKTTVDRLALYAVETGVSMLAAIPSFHTPGKKKDAAAEKLKGFAKLMKMLADRSEKKPLPGFVNDVITLSGYFTELENEDTDQAQSRIENLQEFVSVAADFVKGKEEGEDSAGETLRDFLERIALISSMDTDSKKDRVLLLTMHSAKGLEFPVVFIAGAENGLFPHQRALETKSEMAEERRLAYVAITRAKEHLHICIAQSRMIYGKSETRQPTLFLDEIPQYCLENV